MYVEKRGGVSMEDIYIHTHVGMMHITQDYAWP